MSLPMKLPPDHRSLKICMVASEVVPLAKTGGLADVVGALAIEFAKLGHDVCLVLPCYRQVDALGYQMKDYARLSVPTEQGPIETSILEILAPPLRVTGPGRLRVLAVRHESFFFPARACTKRPVSITPTISTGSLFFAGP